MKKNAALVTNWSKFKLKYLPKPNKIEHIKL